MTSTIVIGGGHNGLTAALKLARSGHSVSIYERRSHPGGLAAPFEFHPGYLSPGILHDTTTLDRRVVTELGLESFGLEWEKERHRRIYPVHGDPFTLDLIHGQHEGLASSTSNGLKQFQEWVRTLTPFVQGLYQGAAPNLIDGLNPKQLLSTGLGALKLGRATLLELSRMIPQNAEDTLEEFIDSPHVRGALMLPSLPGTWMGPLSPSSTAALVLYWALSGSAVRASGKGLTDALITACKDAGVKLHTDATVTAITVKQHRAVGIQLESGETATADYILSTLHPKQTGLNLLPPTSLPYPVRHALQHIRSRAIATRIHYAVNGPLQWAGTSTTPSEIQVGAHPMTLERAFDACKYGHMPTCPVLDIQIPTVRSPQLAPEGHHVVSVLVYGTPTASASLWDDTGAQEKLNQIVQAQIQKVCPDFSAHIVASEVLTPRGLEHGFGALEGQLFHGEWSIDQLWSFRPTADLARTRSPMPGLILAGSGTQGGGGIRGTAGLLGAKAALAG